MNGSLRGALYQTLIPAFLNHSGNRDVGIGKQEHDRRRGVYSYDATHYSGIGDDSHFRMNAVLVAFIDDYRPIPIRHIPADDSSRKGRHGCGFLIRQQLLKLHGNDGMFSKEILLPL